MKTIKFTHQYAKLNVLLPGEDSAKLVLVKEVLLQKLPREFLNWDTDDGLYTFPKSGKYLLLVFETQNGVFHTLRPAWPLYKKSYYEKSLGEMFHIFIKHDVQPAAKAGECECPQWDT